MAPGEEDAVRQHLMEQLQPLCEAEPEVLADYVIVLVEKDVPKEELRENCINELSAFLQDETQAFVTQLFSDLESKPWKKHAQKKAEKKPPDARAAGSNGGEEANGGGLSLSPRQAVSAATCFNSAISAHAFASAL